MKKCRIALLWSVCFIVLQQSFAQRKPVIDTSAFEQWPSFNGNCDITRDGRYASYSRRNGEKVSVIIRSTTGSWQKKLSMTNAKFLANNQQVIYQSKDTLYFVRLGTDREDFIAGVQYSELISNNNNAEWLLYKLKNGNGSLDLHILNTSTNKNISVGHVNDYYFFPNSLSLLFIRTTNNSDKRKHAMVSWYNLERNHEENAFALEDSIPPLVTCKVADQFCYAKANAFGHTSEILYYKRGMPAPITIVDSLSIAKLDSGLILDDWNGAPTTFMKDGKHISFCVKQKKFFSPNQHESKVTIWKYDETFLPTSEQGFDISSRNEFRWSVGLENKKVVPLENRQRRLFLSEPVDGINYLLCSSYAFDGITFWQKGAINTMSLIAVDDGKINIIDSSQYLSSSYYLSPGEHYTVHYDPLQKNYFCFEIATGKRINLTSGMNKEWTRKITSQALSHTSGIGVAAWLPNDQEVLIYADYDIWKFDTKGIRPPVNVTNGLGEKSHIRFRIARETGQPRDRLVLTENQNLLLFAFDSATKKCGFYSKRMNAKADPVLLNMDAYGYAQYGNDDLVLLKAKSTNRWIIRRESASLSPNLFYTADFKNFSQISDVHPEENYNWLTSELVTWKLPNGQHSQGILYKPDNFDSTQKYPVIFTYYEERSDELNQYIKPAYSRDNINIPYFVSHGYLVFVPDIHYKTAEVGESALNSVLSAAMHLSKYPWADSTKMGLQGHSFGGGETNYIITHSGFFTAACESAGPTDAISAYGNLVGYGPNRYAWSRNEIFELGQERMRAGLTEIPEAYIKESPVLGAAYVSTPLLMMHNQNDGKVPWSQAIEFFTGLRRMGKRVWMLEYEGAGHGLIGNDKAAKDYNTRMLQFFDHYLKGAPTPEWMLEDGGLSYDLDKTAPEPEEKEVLFKGKYQKVNQANSSNH